MLLDTKLMKSRQVINDFGGWGMCAVNDPYMDIFKLQ